MDATKKPLRIPPEFSIYAEEHGIFDMYKRLLSQLLIDKPDDPIQFAIDWLKRDHHPVPRVSVVGPAASGKSGISAMLSKKVGAVHVTTSALLDDELSEAAQEANLLIEGGKSVTDSLWVKMVVERLGKKDCVRRGYILEDFPKTREQSLLLQSNGALLSHLVVLSAPDTVLVERQAGRRVDRVTGEVYHTTFDWPQDPTVQARLIEPAGISESHTKKRLAEYARHEDGVISSYPFIHKIINADQPKADVLAQTLTFVNREPRSVAPRTPRIILIGPTGSGKSTVADKLAEKYKLVNVSCGTLLKEHVAGESKLGMAVKEFVVNKTPVPSTLVNKIVVDRLTQLDASTRGWVLHGFPRSREQADGLSDAGIKPNRIFFMDLPEDCVMERLCYRLVDPVSGERYHTLYNPPRSSEVKNRCLAHPDDSEENVKRGMQDYYSYSDELTEYYTDDGAVRINADQDPLTVFEFVESLLVNPLPNKLGADN